MENIIDIISGKEQLFPYLKAIGLKLLSIIILVLILLFIYKVVVKLIWRFLERRSLQTKKSETIKVITATIVRYIIYFTGFIQLLSIFGINTSSFLALSSVVGLAVGLGAQDIIKDILSGFLFIIEDQFNIGDYIVIEGITGCVETINLRTTSIRSSDGGLHIFPNRQITYLSNLTKDFSKAIVDISISYDNNIEEVLKVLNDELNLAFKADVDIVELPKVNGIANFTDSGILLRVIATCNTESQWSVAGKLRLAIKKRFDNEGINISYPHRVVKIEDGRNFIEK